MAEASDSNDTDGLARTGTPACKRSVNGYAAAEERGGMLGFESVRDGDDVTGVGADAVGVSSLRDGAIGVSSLVCCDFW
jgi:hypothetical protein